MLYLAIKKLPSAQTLDTKIIMKQSKTFNVIKQYNILILYEIQLMQIRAKINMLSNIQHSIGNINCFRVIFEKK